MNFFCTAFEDFISGYGIWIVIGVLGLAFIISLVFLILNLRKLKNEKAPKKIKAKTVPIEVKNEEQSINTVEKKIEEKPVVPVIEKQKDNSKGLYSVTYDDDSKQWVVKKSGAARASKRCKTKAEALEYLKGLTEGKDVNVNIHKKDGKFQKK